MDQPILTPPPLLQPLPEGIVFPGASREESERSWNTQQQALLKSYMDPEPRSERERWPSFTWPEMTSVEERLPRDPFDDDGMRRRKRDSSFDDYGDVQRAEDQLENWNEQSREFCRAVHDSMQKMADTLNDYGSRISSIERQIETMEDVGA